MGEIFINRYLKTKGEITEKKTEKLTRVRSIQGDLIKLVLEAMFKKKGNIMASKKRPVASALSFSLMDFTIIIAILIIT